MAMSTSCPSSAIASLGQRRGRQWRPPCSIGRPTKTKSAPSFNAFSTSPPRRMPPSCMSGELQAALGDPFTGRPSRARGAVDLPAAVIGDDYAVDAGPSRPWRHRWLAMTPLMTSLPAPASPYRLDMRPGQGIAPSNVANQRRGKDRRSSAGHPCSRIGIAARPGGRAAERGGASPAVTTPAKPGPGSGFTGERKPCRAARSCLGVNGGVGGDHQGVEARRLDALQQSRDTDRTLPAHKLGTNSSRRRPEPLPSASMRRR